MKRVHVSPDPVHAGWLLSVLESAGITCLLRNGYLGGGIGELPLNECWPEIWVVDEIDEALARRLIAAAEAPREPGDDWRCAGCGELVEGEFECCWQCGRDRDEAPVAG
ncbi:MAG: DUF2007 domain-containing protein [Gammaproteobacteria bacterium]